MVILLWAMSGMILFGYTLGELIFLTHAHADKITLPIAALYSVGLGAGILMIISAAIQISKK